MASAPWAFSFHNAIHHDHSPPCRPPILPAVSEIVRINFGQAIPLFPLEEAVLLPHAVLPLHIFESRYQQMIATAMRTTRQLALAVADDHAGTTKAGKSKHVRPAVCVGQIVQYEPLTAGRSNILLQGLCRARIVRVHEPEKGRLFQIARLKPLESVDEEPAPMPAVRTELRSLLNQPTLAGRLHGAQRVIEWFDQDEVSTHALLELIGFTLVKDLEVRYRLLAEPNPNRRAEIIKLELRHLDHLVRQAERQSFGDWPKGMSWN